MRDIYDCVDTFNTLLDTRYKLILGRKGMLVELEITFDKKDCYHLMGLQYLTDRPELNRDRGKVFDDILLRKIQKEQIESSDLYYKIRERINLLPLLEEILDSNETIFKYNQKSNVFSMIEADYLLKNSIENKNVYLFLSKLERNSFFCRSFFREGKKDYTKNQASWTLLFKKKINLQTHAENILYDKLKNKSV